jgi:hypothetical protein
MLAHVAVNVTDFEGAKRFYLAALEPLGYRGEASLAPTIRACPGSN